MSDSFVLFCKYASNTTYVTDKKYEPTITKGNLIFGYELSYLLLMTYIV